MAITVSILNGFSKFFHCWKVESQITFQQNPYNISYHTFNMLPHYLAKVRSSSFGISEKNADENVTYFDF